VRGVSGDTVGGRRSQRTCGAVQFSFGKTASYSRTAARIWASRCGKAGRGGGGASGSDVSLSASDTPLCKGRSARSSPHRPSRKVLCTPHPPKTRMTHAPIISPLRHDDPVRLQIRAEGRVEGAYDDRAGGDAGEGGVPGGELEGSDVAPRGRWEERRRRWRGHGRRDRDPTCDQNISITRSLKWI
jgi:hypothetical protein